MNAAEFEQFLKKRAERLFPYDTESDKFTRDLRNGCIDLLRRAYIQGFKEGSSII